MNVTQKSERLKRRERRQQIKDGMYVADSCINLTNELQICPLNNKKQKYEERKTQPSGKDNEKIKKNGIEYDYNKHSIRELFDDHGISMKKDSLYGMKKNRQSYIYIISKVIDNRTFFKIGYSDIANNAVVGVRLESHKTTLIPGLKNIGFKLHYLFFYDRLLYGSETSYAHLIEQELHKFLRNHKEYKTFVIHYPSSRPSEWYLPDEGKYQEFMDYVLYFLSVQVPNPKQAYWFLIHKNKERRFNMDEFFPETTPEDIREFRHDFSAQMENIKITQKTEKTQIQLKKGSLSYFKKSLLTIKDNKPPLGDDVNITNIIFYNKSTTTLLKSREYYVLIQCTTKPFDWLNSFIPLIGKSELLDQTTSSLEYITHISHVLQKMKSLNTIDLYELRSNLNHYDDVYIEEAKSSFMTTFSENVSILKKDLLWIVGRYLKDKSNKVYIVTKLNTLSNNATKVDKITCTEVNPQNLKIINNNQKIVGNVFTIIHLVVEYHDEIQPSLYVKDNYVKTMKHLNPNHCRFELYDLIVIGKGYYKNPSNNTPIQQEFDGLITNIEVKLWKKGESPALCYDILFEDGSEWFHVAESIDKNAKLKHKSKTSKIYKQSQKSFLNNIRGPLQAQARYIMEVLDFVSPNPIPSIVKRTTKKRNKKGKNPVRRSTRKKQIL